ncbi:hypothetical protein F5X97DRAFT_330728 [Nemania serpens]|nr:hypothetical protein F5X97DRAFT_330728 [Nemania serpens]
MDSSFTELVRAAPGHGSSASQGATATGVGDSGAGNGAPGNGSPDSSAMATTMTVPVATTAPGPGPVPAPARAPAAQTLAAPSQFSQASHSSSSPSISRPDLNNPPSTSASTTTSTSAPSSHNTLHAHRQNHNSSKLPAFRFTDLNKESIASPLLLPHQPHQTQTQTQNQHHHIPPSPVSPAASDQHPETRPKNAVNHLSSKYHASAHRAVSPAPPLEHADPVRSRASTFQLAPAPLPAAKPPAHVKRATSLDNAVSRTTGLRSASRSSETIVTVLQRPRDKEPPSGGPPAEATTTKEGLSGQRELYLIKTLQRTASDEKRASVARKPPVSYKPRTTSGSSSTTSIPPIRSFRSSLERRSIVLDMNIRSARTYDGGDDYEGRRADDSMQWTPPDSAGERPDGDDTTDLFLKIAREDNLQRTPESRTYADNPNAITRVARSARRPLSVAISSYRSPSPPRLSRRMSEQEARARGLGHDQGERTGPPVSYRGHSREPHSEDMKLRGASTPLRASPLTPRTLTYQDPPEPTSAQRRRQPSIDRASAVASRMVSIKQANVNYSHPRAYNSSPLVPLMIDPPKHDAPANETAAVEGTDSTTSTAAPSTVWDELEELKSRIHRLELTGKLPPTSSAAISRASDERPPTAHTNATTLSASPKRAASSVVQSTDGAAQPKDSHPLLHSALAKSKDFLAPGVYDALETAIVDALTLAAMMGTAGQPGPISSGASNIGSGTGTVTDRQLRKKADSVCRSLTELCLALSENAGASKPQQPVVDTSEDVTVTQDMLVASPTITQFTGVATHRRPSAPANRAVELPMSPRTMSRYEEKRATVLTASALPGLRYNANVLASTEANTAGRKSSILFSRSRRAGTEEPEEGRKTSTLLRSRRAGTEEPEEASDRKPILTRGRRATIDPGEDESRFRNPSRAVTEVNGPRPREYITQLPPPPVPKEPEVLAGSALPRRRMVSTTLNTRLTQPTVTTTTAPAVVMPNRRYLDRPAPGREMAPEPDRMAEDRPQRQFALGRSGSLNRRVTNRQSMIATPSTGTTSYYR